MQIEFDATKSEANIRERGLGFELASGFDFGTARIWEDTRKVYPEVRMLALGYLGQRLHVLCFNPKSGGVRVISFRKANQRKGDKHGFALTCD